MVYIKTLMFTVVLVLFGCGSSEEEQRPTTQVPQTGPSDKSESREPLVDSAQGLRVNLPFIPTTLVVKTFSNKRIEQEYAFSNRRDFTNDLQIERELEESSEVTGFFQCTRNTGTECHLGEISHGSSKHQYKLVYQSPVHRTKQPSSHFSVFQFYKTR